MSVIALETKQKKRKTTSDLTETWTIRGIPHEARAAATIASRKMGQTIGEFVSRAIQEQAKLVNATPAPTNDDTLKAIFDKMEAMSSKIEGLEQRRGFFSRVFR